MKNYIRRFKASRTVRLAFFKSLGGSITIIIASLGYFESAVTPSVFGAITILFGIADYQIRLLTTKKLN